MILESPHELWSVFARLLVDRFGAVDQSDLATAWSSFTLRTDWYAQHVLPAVAAVMGLQYCREFLLVDYALCATAPGGSAVPVIFVESENDSTSAVQEVRKLCALAAPVRVLLTVAEWDTTPGVWPHGGTSAGLLREWRLACDDYSYAYGTLPGIVAAVIGEWRTDDSFRVYTHKLGGVGWPAGCDTVALHQQMAARQPSS